MRLLSLCFRLGISHNLGRSMKRGFFFPLIHVRLHVVPWEGDLPDSLNT